jgi:uncharacterized Zn finger protein
VSRGPWSRLLVAEVVDDEETIAAERARELARAGRVRDLTVEPGTIRAQVVGTGGRVHDVALETRPLPQRVWAAEIEAAAGRPELEAAIAGRAQSSHLHHELAAEWGEPLVPRGKSLRATCTCSAADPCQHALALAYAAADALDDDPSLLLRWRDVPAVEPGAPLPEPDEPTLPADAWAARGPLPELAPPRALPPTAVLMRLGPSGVAVGGRDLADALQGAYEHLRT